MVVFTFRNDLQRAARVSLTINGVVVVDDFELQQGRCIQASVNTNTAVTTTVTAAAHAGPPALVELNGVTEVHNVERADVHKTVQQNAAAAQYIAGAAPAADDVALKVNAPSSKTDTVKRVAAELFDSSGGTLSIGVGASVLDVVTTLVRAIDTHSSATTSPMFWGSVVALSCLILALFMVGMEHRGKHTPNSIFKLCVQGDWAVLFNFIKTLAVIGFGALSMMVLQDLAQASAT